MGPELPFQAEDVKALKPDAKVDPTVLPSAVVPETAWELDAGAGAAPSLGPFIFSRLVDVRLSQRSARWRRFSRMMMISLPEMRPVRQPRYSLRTRAIFSSRAARVMRSTRAAMAASYLRCFSFSALRLAKYFSRSCSALTLSSSLMDSSGASFSSAHASGVRPAWSSSVTRAPWRSRSRMMDSFVA